MSSACKITFYRLFILVLPMPCSLVITVSDLRKDAIIPFVNDDKVYSHLNEKTKAPSHMV
jgi:hypothetical protein